MNIDYILSIVTSNIPNIRTTSDMQRIDELLINVFLDDLSKLVSGHSKNMTPQLIKGLDNMDRSYHMVSDRINSYYKTDLFKFKNEHNMVPALDSNGFIHILQDTIPELHRLYLLLGINQCKN